MGSITTISRQLCLSALLTGTLATVSLGSTVEADERIAKADALLRKGKHSKARDLFSAVDRDADGGSADALIGMVRASNELEDYAEAHGTAVRLRELVPAGPSRVWSAGELAYAVAAGDLAARRDLELAVEEIRAFLAPRPAGNFAKSLRVRLCAARNHLDDTDPLGLGPGAIDPASEKPVKDVAIQVRNPRAQVIVRGELGNLRRFLGNVEARLLGIIDRDGCLGNVEILHNSAPDNEAMLVAWARGYVFEPVELDGLVQPVFNLLVVRSSSD